MSLQCLQVLAVPACTSFKKVNAFLYTNPFDHVRSEVLHLSKSHIFDSTVQPNFKEEVEMASEASSFSFPSLSPSSTKFSQRLVQDNPGIFLWIPSNCRVEQSQNSQVHSIRWLLSFSKMVQNLKSLYKRGLANPPRRSSFIGWWDLGSRCLMMNEGQSTPGCCHWAPGWSVPSEAGQQVAALGGHLKVMPVSFPLCTTEASIATFVTSQEWAAQRMVI